MVRSLHRSLPQTVHVWKINARFANGVADAWYSGGRADQWVEYKWLPRAPVDAFTVPLTPLQQKWLNDRRSEGRSVAVIVGTPAGFVVLTDGEWNEPVKVQQWMTRGDVLKWITTTVS
jgi:hypothetical protein